MKIIGKINMKKKIQNMIYFYLEKEKYIKIRIKIIKILKK